MVRQSLSDVKRGATAVRPGWFEGEAMRKRRAAGAKTSSGSAAKALGVLEAVIEEPRSVSVTELGVMLNMSKPPAYRIAATLETMDYLKRESGGRRLIERDRLVPLALKVLEAPANSATRHALRPEDHTSQLQPHKRT